MNEAAIVRAATLDDVATLDAIVQATEPPSTGSGPAGSPPAGSPPAGSLSTGSPAEPPIASAGQAAYLAHLVARGRVLVAILEHRVVGFGATVDTGRSIHLADLFVLPADQGRGIGGRLVDALFTENRAPRTTFASDDPRAVPLYVRLGMRPLWPTLYLSGEPARVPAPPADHALEDISLAAMADLERRWTGVERRPDLDYLAAMPESRPFAVMVGGSPVAAGLCRRRYRTPDLWLDHVQVAPDADPLPAFLAAFRRGAGEGRATGGCVPGPSAVLGALLGAGFQIIERDTFMASAGDLVDPEREAVNTGLL